MENNNSIRIDLTKLFRFIFKHCWLPILLAALCGGWVYYDTVYRMMDTYTASGTFYVYNSNPNLVNYQYATSTDLDSAVKLIDTYMIVVRSNKVMDVVTERLAKDYPGITAEFISATLSMASVSETGVAKVSSRTVDPQLSTDIVNAVLDVAPQEIIRVVGAGNIEIIDYAVKPAAPDYRRTVRRTAIGVIAGGLLACIILLVVFLLNRKVTTASDLTSICEQPLLSSIKRQKKHGVQGEFMITRQSSLEILEGYAKLRMNLLYTLIDKDSHSVALTSAISGEGKTTIAANLAISCAMGGKNVLLIDGDMRRGSQRDNFGYPKQQKGLSDVLAGDCSWRDAVIPDVRETLDLLPSGLIPPNPAELLSSENMKSMLSEIEKEYDLVLLDMPPVNIVTDCLVISNEIAGCLFVVRQNYSDQRDIRSAMKAIDMMHMNVLGLVLYGEKINQENYYRRRYYRRYYNDYDNRKKHGE